MKAVDQTECNESGQIQLGITSSAQITSTISPTSLIGCSERAYIADPGILSVQSDSELSELLIASRILGSAVAEGVVPAMMLT